MTATWSLLGVTGTPSDGVVTVAVTAADPAGNVSGASDDIIADNTAPTPLTGLAAGPGHKKVDLSWDDPTGNDTYFDGLVIRYAAWGDYPIYAPPEPDYPADQTAGDGEAFDGAGTSATHAFVDDDRDIYYYAGFVYDVARNYSPVEGGGGHQARSTNYWLGDVSDGIYGQYDGFVDVADVTALGSTYYLCRGDPGFKDEVDIGPTHDDSRLGIPIPDGCVDFDDLMMMAMNFGIVTPLHPGAMKFWTVMHYLQSLLPVRLTEQKKLFELFGEPASLALSLAVICGASLVFTLFCSLLFQFRECLYKEA